MELTWTQGLDVKAWESLTTGPGGGVAVDIAAWLKEHEGRDASCVIRLWGLDDDYVDYKAWAEDGVLRTEPLPTD